MLTNEMMGAFCLGVVWLNTLLIVAHVWQAQRALTVERVALGPVVRGKVVTADALAVVEVAQIGRAITTGGPERILFTESSRTARVREGTVEIDARRIDVAPMEHARVWALGASGTRNVTDFDDAHRSASTNRGLPATMTLPVGASGADVWLAGERGDGSFRIAFVSDRDPAAVVASGRVRAFGFIVATLAVLVGISALALVRPWFSGLSTLGGMLAVAYFLSVQPLAVALRESIAVPEKRKIGGIWQRS